MTIQEGINDFEELGIFGSEAFDDELLCFYNFSCVATRSVLEVAVLARLLSASNDSLCVICCCIVVALMQSLECLA